MEYWDYTLKRSLDTLPVWNRHLEDLKIAGQGVDALEEMIFAFEPLAQAVVQATLIFDDAHYNATRSLEIMKLLGTKVPMLIQGHLEENGSLMKDVQLLFQTAPRTEATILKRARELYPVWLWANTAMAALIPSQPEILRAVQGVPHSAAMLKGLIDGYADLLTVLEEKAALLRAAKEAQRKNDTAADRLNKRFYQIAKAGDDPGSPLHVALKGIPVEPSTPPPQPIEIATVTQGGEGGLQVLVTCETGGGKHATVKQVQWMVEGVDGDFTHSAPLTAKGAPLPAKEGAKGWAPVALGPFAPGQAVKVRTLAGNSAAKRTGAPRTVRIEEAIA